MISRLEVKRAGKTASKDYLGVFKLKSRENGVKMKLGDVRLDRGGVVRKDSISDVLRFRGDASKVSKMKGTNFLVELFRE